MLCLAWTDIVLVAKTAVMDSLLMAQRPLIEQGSAVNGDAPELRTIDGVLADPSPKQCRPSLPFILAMSPTKGHLRLKKDRDRITANPLARSWARPAL